MAKYLTINLKDQMVILTHGSRDMVHYGLERKMANTVSIYQEQNDCLLLSGIFSHFFYSTQVSIQ